MNAIKVIESNEKGLRFSAKEFLSFLRKSNDIWWSEENEKCHWIFRGQYNHKWRLLPSAWRESNKKFEPLLKKIALLPPPKEEKLSSRELEFRQKSNIEFKAISDFNNLAGQLGLSVPENHLPDPLSQRFLMAYPFHVIKEILPLAQHYGIPTRLLDWTENPIFAAYFSVGKEYRTEENPENVCVWALNLKRLNGLWSTYKPNDYSISINTVYDYKYRNDFLKAQEGLFTRLDGGIGAFYRDTGRFPSLDEVVEIMAEKQNIDSPILLKILLAKSEINNLLILLNREGINQARLMPSYDKVGEVVISRWNIT